MNPDREIIAERFKTIQDSICAALENCDGKAQFIEDKWERPGGGGGRTRILQHGNIIEKGGVNFSAVHGELPENVALDMKLPSNKFFATGVSIVQHPNHPLVPIIHMNIRYFELDDGTCWFGGGIDLTPHYVFEEDARWFHGKLKAVCDRFDEAYYPRFKQWADDYFFIPHRNETRGVGGIFFDKLKPGPEKSKEELLEFVASVGEAFAEIYTTLIDRHRSKAYTDAQAQWQRIRRGRYVEFNLVYDRGTKFGLQTAGRIESILMSLPEDASWFYNHVPEVGSEEEKTAVLLRKGIDWV